MMKKSLSFLAAIAFAFSANAEIIQYSPSSGASIPSLPVPLADGGTGSSTAVGALTNLGAASRLVPVCNQVYDSDGGQNSAGQQTMSRIVFYCPQGATSLSLVYTGFYMSGTTETSSVDPMLFNAGVVTGVPAPWSASTAYTTGQSVTYNATQTGTGTFGNNPIYTAAAGSTNSAPIPTNANWSAGAVPSPIPVTCNGGRVCQLGTFTSASLAPAPTTQPIITTDPVQVSVPAGGYISVYTWTNQTGTQKLYAQSPEIYTEGAYYTQGTTSTDLTLTAANSNKVSLAGIVAPTGVIGLPLANKPTVAIIGDSRALGIDGNGLSSIGIAAAGSGFTSADEGVICPLPDTGASSFEVGRSAQVIITQITAGAVSSAQIYDPGSYAGTTSGQTLPSGTQTFTGCGHGTGFGVTPSFNSSGRDFGDQYYARGYLQRAIAESQLTFTGAVHSGDTVAGWNTRDYDRLAFLQKTCVRNVVIELGINDIGTTPATTEASLVKIANQLLGNGCVQAVYLATMPPYATSTDGFATTTNQTTNANNANRVTLNDWDRTVPAPFTGYLETADPVESSRDSGLWKVTGTGCNSGNTAQVNVYSCDGLHETSYGVTQTVTTLGNLSTFFQ
jgi:hypothetical protein